MSFFPRCHHRCGLLLVSCLVLALSVPRPTQARKLSPWFQASGKSNPVSPFKIMKTNVMTSARGGSSEKVATHSPVGTLKSKANRLLWNLPFVVAILSFYTFRPSMRLLERLIEFSTGDQPWLPSTDEQVNLQTNVITQVINGPVITSISVLFASLISLTISRLHGRQIAIQKSITWEVHKLRIMQSLLASPAGTMGLSDSQRTEILELVQNYSDSLFSYRYSSSSERADTHTYIESNLPAVIQWCNRVLCDYRSAPSNRRGRQGQLSPEPVVAEIQSLAHGMLEERGNRWMSLLAVPFPFVHYATLVFLAASICVSFLISTAQARVLFRDDGFLSARVLWTVLLTSFATISVLCYDLYRPFVGAYLVAEERKAPKPPKLTRTT